MSLKHRSDRMANFVTMSMNYLSRADYRFSLTTDYTSKEIAFMAIGDQVITNHHLAHHYFNELVTFCEEHILDRHPGSSRPDFLNMRVHLPISKDESTFTLAYLITIMAARFNFKVHVYGDMNALKTYLLDKPTEHGMFQVIEKETVLIDIEDESFANKVFHKCDNMVAIYTDNTKAEKVLEQCRAFGLSVYFENLLMSAHYSASIDKPIYQRAGALSETLRPFHVE